MTKQSVVVPEVVAITVAAVPAATSPALFPYPPPRSVLGGGAAAIRKKYLAQLEVAGGGGCNGHGGRINAWVETMKASSPTHSKEAAALPVPAAGEHATWAKRHPSALAMFNEITNASEGKQIVMFLDYDGTLSPIVDDPDRAFMSESMRDAVRAVAKYFPTAIVSGRCRDKVYEFVKLTELYYAGSHGMDIKGPARGKKHTKSKANAVLFQPASEFLPMIDEVCKALVERTKSTPGAKVENNKFCASVHFRCVDEKKWSALAEQVRSVLREYPKLKLTQGRKVLEIRPTIKWDKGKALEFLLESLGKAPRDLHSIATHYINIIFIDNQSQNYLITINSRFADCSNVLPVYIGDDRTDEDAFKVLRERGQGFGILVSKFPKETGASYSLQEPSEVMDFLHRLVEWKRLSLKGYPRV